MPPRVHSSAASAAPHAGESGSRAGAPKTAEREARMEMQAVASDTELLIEYRAGRSERAFRRLVERYQVMVLGTAFRRTGNLETAHDVTQRVYAVLARRAGLLIGRSSVAGWLHHATVYEAIRAVRIEARERVRRVRFVDEIIYRLPDLLPNRKRWAALDDAIAGLATPDREALVLRSFQGLSYGEMARTLGTDEPAIRKRVSRALTRLGRALRIRGETGDAALLLAGAAGIQATLVVPPGLAEVALAAAGIGASPFLTLTALFSNSTVRIAATLLALASVPALWFVTTRARNPAEAALHARRETASPPPRHDAVMPPTTSNRASTASANAASPTIADSPVRTTSPVPSATQTAFKIPRPPPRVVPVIVTTRFHRQPRIIAARSSERESSTATALRGRSDDGVSTPLQQLANLELQPEVAAMFFGDLLEEVLALDPLQRLALTQFLSEQFTRLNAAGLAGPKPAAFAAAVWGAQRGLAIDEMVRGLHDILADSDTASGILRAMLTLSDDSRDEPAARPANPRDNSPAANLSRTLSKASSAAGRDLTPIVISKLPHSP